MASASHVHTHVTLSLDQNERRVRIVVWITLAMMLLEIAVGFGTGSLALLADGWHMGSHAGALGLSAWAYWYARKHSGSNHYSFGTGKLMALVGYTNAILLLVVAGLMAFEASERLRNPTTVRFDEALVVAVLGLLVNVVSALVLETPNMHADHDHHDHEHHDHEHHHHDSNMRAAYLHVVADAVTSVAAVAALVGGKYFGWTFLDPVMAIVGSLVIVSWGVGLIKSTARQLLDADPQPGQCGDIRAAIEAMGATRVVDLHLWQIGPRERSCIVSLVTTTPKSLAEYRLAVLGVAKVDHLTIEVEHRDSL